MKKLKQKGFYVRSMKFLSMLCILLLLITVSGCSDDNDEPKNTITEGSESGDGGGDESTGMINGYEWVDLGLPSGLKWATCNVGATNSWDYGDYYAWGETTTKSTYTIDSSIIYGKPMGDISGDSRYDVATADWGGTWRLPTKTEIEELVNNCTWTLTSKGGHNGQGGHNGYEVTGKNGNSIFLPNAGYRDGSLRYRVEAGGYYWSSTPYESGTGYACSLYFYSGDCYRGYYQRYYGQSVRPVTE